MKHIFAFKTTAIRLVCLMIVFALSSTSVNASSVGFLSHQTNQSRAIAHYMMGVLYDLSGLSVLAIQEYELAVQYQDDVALSRLRLGSNYARIGKLDEASEQLTKAAELNPHDLQSRHLLALIYSMQRKFDLAASEYEAILKASSQSDSQKIDIYFYLGQLYYSQGQYDKAALQFKRILELDPENTEVMYLLSSFYLDKDQREDAMLLLKECIAVEAMKHPGCYNSLAYVYAEDNIHLDRALSFVEEALRQEPNNGAYLDTLGWVYYRQGKYEEALVALNKANEVIEDYIVYDHIGDVYLAMNRHQEAQQYWRLALELMPNEPSILEKLNNVGKHSVKNEQ